MDQTTPTAADRRRIRPVVVVALIVIVAAGVTLLLVRDDSTSDPKPAAEPTTTQVAEPSAQTTAAPNEPPATEPNETAPATTVMISTLVRPVTDPDVCIPISAEGWSASGLPRNQSSNVPITLFARPSALPIPIQIIGEQRRGDVEPPGRTPGLSTIERSRSPDLLWEFGADVDRPAPLDVGMVDDSVIIIAGLDDAASPTIADVRTADEEEWRRLLIEQPEPPGVPLPIGEVAEVSVEFAPIDDTATPVSSLSWRLSVEDGVAFFEIDTTDAVIAPEAEYWKIEVDGRIRSRSSAASTDSGGVMGVRLGEAPLTAPFTATVSTTDDDDFTIQTTGPILLEQIME